MCGITAFINFSNKLTVKELLEFNRIISHRGPDGEGLWFKWQDGITAFCYSDHTPKSAIQDTYNYLPTHNVEEFLDRNDYKIGFGHRRLSILDLSHCGHQPMSTENEDVVITFNGEIYNHAELKAELTELGYTFRSKTDTEVIIYAYKQWGIDCLKKFNGMFSFVLYDKQRDKLYAIRDRFGVKPLYYYIYEGAILFASEIKQFTTLPNWKAVLNNEPAQVFLWTGVIDYSNQTMFRDVYQVRGGHYLELSLNQSSPMFEVNKWYDITEEKRHIGEYDEAVQTFKSLFTDAVDLRLRADVNVCTGLSGGLDSSSIVCTSAELIKNRDSHVTFSARSTDPNLDEGRYIEEVINKTGVKNYEIWPDILELETQMKDLIWHQDEPFGGTSYFAEWKIYEKIKSQSIKVSLEGHGADEILLGYHYNFKTYASELLRSFKILDFIKLTYILHSKYKYSIKELGKLVVYLSIKNVLRKFKNQVSKQSKAYFIDGSLALSAPNFYKSHISGINTLKLASLQQLLYSSLPYQLHSVDRSSMAFSIESRAPFLDYRVVELLYNCPSEYKLILSTTKRILRDAMKGILPEKIRNRSRKIGFATPEEKWMLDNKEYFISKLEDICTRRKKFISPEIHQMLLDIINGKASYKPFLWRIIIFDQWLEIFNIDLDLKPL